MLHDFWINDVWRHRGRCDISGDGHSWVVGYANAVFQNLQEIIIHRKFSITTENEADTYTANKCENSHRLEAGIRTFIITSDPENAKHNKPQHIQQKSLRTGRTVSCSRQTLINIVITIVFALTILPKVTFMIIESSGTGFLHPVPTPTCLSPSLAPSILSTT